MPIAKLLRDSKAPSRTLSERRQAAWLQSEYSDPVWRVADTDNPKKTKIIDFRQVLADGQMLTEVEGLYATVCESAWNKDPVFGVIGIQTGPRG
jgi:hypothetical protein